MPTQIVIQIQNGCLQQVFCSDSAAEVFVIHQGDIEPPGGIQPESVVQIAALPAHELAGSDIEAAIERACNIEALLEGVTC